MDDKHKFQYEGLKWLYELEMLNHPQLINNLKLNVLSVSKRIKEVELLIYRENKSMLILIELDWFGKFSWVKSRIFSEILDVLSQLLPNFRLRVTDDPKIMEMAVETVKRALTGGIYENVSSNNTVVDSDSNDESPRRTTNGPTTEGSDQSSGSENQDSNLEEQAKAPIDLRKETGESDPQGQQ